MDKNIFFWGVFFLIIGFAIISAQETLDIAIGSVVLGVGIGLSIVSIIRDIKDRNKNEKNI